MPTESANVHFLRFGRKRRLWVWTLAVGVLSFALAWWAENLLVRARFYALPALLGIVYNRGMTQAAVRTAQSGQAGPVVVLEIGESTYERLRRVAPFYPDLPAELRAGPLRFKRPDHQRLFHARVVENLKRLGAKVVAFDMVFDEEEPDADPHLARALKAHGRVLLATLDDRGVELGGRAERTHALQVPAPALREVSAGMGVVNLPLDTDKTVRRFQWWLIGIDEETAEDVPYPALGVAAAALYAGRDLRDVIQSEVEPEGKFLGRPIRWQPGPEAPTSLIRFHGLRGAPAGPDSVIPYENVFLVGTPEVNREMEQQLRAQIQGKIVLVGDATLIGQDFHRVPVLSPGVNGESSQESPGVETQAQIILTALSGDYPVPASPRVQVVLLLVACLLCAVLGKLLDPRLHLLTTVLIIWGIGYASIKLLAWYGVVMEPVTAIFGVGLAFIGQGVLMHFAERRGREFARRQLGRHVGAGAAARLVDDDELDLEGEEVELTMLFSDLQGFTTLSETRSSREMCDVLNEYFGEVIFPIVAKHGGSTDKLMGDGLMAYFGWPERHPDHAARAVRCALEMQMALDRWQGEPDNVGLPPLRTRIGIHTGEATVGLIGSGERVELTVIGDVVNVASRLEGMNKTYGSTILISEATRLAAGDVGPLIARGEATVRGRTEPMPVYSLEPLTDNSSEAEALARAPAVALGSRESN